MCRPDYFTVRYVINPWMEGNLGKVSARRALSQWETLWQRLSELAEVELAPPQADLPDMTFTANAGLVWGKTAILSRFYHAERRGEEAHFKAWFQSHGYTVYELPPDVPFEGAGDALLDTAQPWLWCAYGPRTELDAHPFLARHLPLEILSLRLIDRRFYHLDTCFCPLPAGRVLYFPAAFDERSRRLIESRVPSEKRFEVSESDAAHFACNAIVVGQNIVLNRASAELKKQLDNAGLQVIETPLDEFMKSGGAAKCLTLHLNPATHPNNAGLCSVASRVMALEGHLLDSGSLNRAIDLSVENGGSFRVLDFNLGRQRQSISQARLHLSAPDSDTLDRITALLLPLGARPEIESETDAQCETVTQNGVAPDNFYATTIYPTEVRFNGQWVRVTAQRMDAVIVVENNAARCALIRDLQMGWQVITGVQGIRTQREVPVRAASEFEFMAAGASSERRVELVARQLAWRMRRVRESQGRCVVVAGPVVIHTGGGEDLAALVRAGYVQALLGGNAIAVHDIEQAFYGTSLGVDLHLGTGVAGGHRHHLRAINIIRQCGGITPAVQSGVLQSGVFYECVRADVPFALAGSIRDDGPLPDTEMNLIAAQEQYAELLRGADLIVMLATMLHAIGAGNMTPAGVPLYCVDINPAVVTKLTDRGSLEATGVVTDAGLFLGLLRRELDL